MTRPKQPRFIPDIEDTPEGEWTVESAIEAYNRLSVEHLLLLDEKHRLQTELARVSENYTRLITRRARRSDQ